MKTSGIKKDGNSWKTKNTLFPDSHLEDEVTGERRKRHNEELHNLYSSPNTIRMIKSRG
jgi:hypothetical protein